MKSPDEVPGPMGNAGAAFTSRLDSGIAKRLLLATGLLYAAGIGVAVFAPLLSVWLRGNAKPSYLILASTGIVIIALTAIFLSYLGKVIGLSSAWLVAAIVYNAMIIAVKFLFSPMALYRQVFVLGFLKPDPNSFSFYLITAAGVFAIYLIALLLIRRKYQKVIQSEMDANHKKDVSMLHPRVHVGLWTRSLYLMIALAITVGVVFVVFPIGVFGPLYVGGYLAVFTGALGLLLLIALSVALFAARRAFHEAAATAVDVRSVAIYTAFFWSAFALLLLYHILWVIFISMFVAIHPLRTVAPSGK